MGIGARKNCILRRLGASWGPRRTRSHRDAGAALRKFLPGVVPGTPPKSDLKKIALGRPGASKTLPRWVPSWTQKIQFWRLKLASIWKGSWSPRAPQSNFFGGPSCSPLGTPPQKKKWPPGKESILKSDFFFWWGAVLGGQLGPPKKCSATPWGPNPLPKWMPTWASKTECFGVQLGTHLGKVLEAPGCPRAIFLRSNLEGVP